MKELVKPCVSVWCVYVFLVPQMVIVFRVKSYGTALRRLSLTLCAWDWLVTDQSHRHIIKMKITEFKGISTREKSTKEEWLISINKGGGVITARSGSQIHTNSRPVAHLPQIAIPADNISTSLRTIIYLVFDKLSLLFVCTCVGAVYMRLLFTSCTHTWIDSTSCMDLFVLCLYK